MQEQKQKIQNLPPVSEILKQHGFYTKKNLGQNFIFDLNVTSKVVKHAGNIAGETVIEIGPGAGSLTRPILMEGPDKLIVVEKDQRCLPILEELKDIVGNRLEIVNEDALTLDYGKLLNGRKAKVISNLPYNVGTELLMKWLENPELFSSFTLMFQKEVAERICAESEDEAYGRLSIISNLLCDCRILFEVPPTVFFPPPKVYSAIISLIPYSEPKFKVDVEQLKKVTRNAFGQRRKSIRNSLKPLMGKDVSEKLQSLGIDSNLRAENLTVEQFCKIAGII